MRFFTGLHHPNDAKHFDSAFVSVNAIRKRVGPFAVGDWIMDSGGFTEIASFGEYRTTVAEYAALIRRWKRNGRLLAAVAQDWVCDPRVLARTGLTVAEHQRRTIERYDQLLAEDVGVYILPVLQGYRPEEFARHVRDYGDRLAQGAWVAVGSLVGRSRDSRAIGAILQAIKEERPDLRLHGFGLKTDALANPLVRGLLESADSMAWSRTARHLGRNQNDWREAKAWTARIESRPVQYLLDLLPSDRFREDVVGGGVDVLLIADPAGRLAVNVVGVAVEGPERVVEAAEIGLGQEGVDVGVPVKAEVLRLLGDRCGGDRALRGHRLLVGGDHVAEFDQAVHGREDQDADPRREAGGDVVRGERFDRAQGVLKHGPDVEVARFRRLGCLGAAAGNDVGDLVHFGAFASEAPMYYEKQAFAMPLVGFFAENSR